MNFEARLVTAISSLHYLALLPYSDQEHIQCFQSFYAKGFHHSDGLYRSNASIMQAIQCLTNKQPTSWRAFWVSQLECTTLYEKNSERLSSVGVALSYQLVVASVLVFWYYIFMDSKLMEKPKDKNIQVVQNNNNNIQVVWNIGCIWDHFPTQKKMWSWGLKVTEVKWVENIWCFSNHCHKWGFSVFQILYLKWVGAASCINALCHPDPSSLREFPNS